MERDFALLQEWNGKVGTPFGAQHARATQIDVPHIKTLFPPNAVFGLGIRVGRAAAGEDGIVGVTLVVEVIGVVVAGIWQDNGRGLTDWTDAGWRLIIGLR